MTKFLFIKMSKVYMKEKPTHQVSLLEHMYCSPGTNTSPYTISACNILYIFWEKKEKQEGAKPEADW